MSWKDKFTCCIDRWNKKCIVISPDLDGIISAVALCHIYGSRIIGIYDTRRIIVFDEADREELVNALWLDHDIQNKNILSIGHHLLQIGNEELLKFNEDSFNPNVYFGMNWRNCFLNRTKNTLNKFPYSTIILLTEALNIRIPNIGTKGYSLILQADGLIDVSLEYRENCLKWKDMMFDNSFIINSIIEGEYFQEKYKWIHSLLIDDLSDMNLLNKSSSKSITFKSDKSKDWYFCKGYQSLIDKTNIDALNEMIRYICINTGWLLSRSQLPTKVTSINRMNVSRINPNNINLNQLNSQNVFSFAITFRDTLKVTTV
jgi:hypothetical protein